MRLRSEKQAFANDVIHTIHHLCKIIFNISHDAQMEKMFGITHEQMEGVIKKIVNKLPEKIFTSDYAPKLEEVKIICAREYIFFQVQERHDDPSYDADLEKFLKIFAKDIQKQI